MCEWSLATPKPTGTRVHGLSAVPVKRRCGRSVVTAAKVDLVGKKSRVRTLLPQARLAERRSACMGQFANSVPSCTYCTMTPINRIAVWKWDSTASATEQTPQSLEPALLNNGVVYGICSPSLCPGENGLHSDVTLSSTSTPRAVAQHQLYTMNDARLYKSGSVWHYPALCSPSIWLELSAVYELHRSFQAPSH